MKTLIIYASRFGTAKKCADMLASLLHDAEISSIGSAPVSLARYGAVILGGGVYAGQTDNKLKEYLKNHTGEIGRIPHGFFVCCADPDYNKFILENFPAPLLENAVATGGFGAGIDVSYAKGFNRFIAKIFNFFNKKGKLNYEIFEDKIAAFADTFKEIK